MAARGISSLIKQNVTSGLKIALFESLCSSDSKYIWLDFEMLCTSASTSWNIQFARNLNTTVTCNDTGSHAISWEIFVDDFRNILRRFRIKKSIFFYVLCVSHISSLKDCHGPYMLIFYIWGYSVPVLQANIYCGHICLQLMTS